MPSNKKFRDHYRGFIAAIEQDEIDKANNEIYDEIYSMF